MQSERKFRKSKSSQLKADKGFAVVVMNTTDYLHEGYRQLSDTKFNRKIQYDTTENIANKVRQILTHMKQKGLISEKTFEHLSPDIYSEAKFYMLPKYTKRCTWQTNM